MKILTKRQVIHISYLENCGLGGEWELFAGAWNGSALEWGGSCWIEGEDSHAGQKK